MGRTAAVAAAVHEPIGVRSFLLACAVSVLWGGNLVAIRVGIDSFPPIWSAFWRMLVGLAVVVPWAASRGVSLWPRPGEWRLLFFLGVLFTAQIGLLNAGTALTSPAYGVVILNSYAVFANIVGHFWRGPGLEARLTPLRVLGLAIALAGLTILVTGQAPGRLAVNPLVGNMMMIVSAFLLGYRQVYTRWLVQDLNPMRAVIWQMAWSLPLFAAYAAWREPLTSGPITAGAVGAILYQGLVVAGFCFVIWAELLKRHAAGAISMFAFLVPVSGIVLSGVLFGEPLTTSLVVGGLLALGGVFVVTKAPA